MPSSDHLDSLADAADELPLHSLRVFIAAVRCGSFSARKAKAGRRSRHYRSLELRSEPMSPVNIELYRPFVPHFQ